MIRMPQYSHTRQFSDDEDIDDDYYVASFHQSIPKAVILSPEELDKQTRVRMCGHIEGYLRRCRNVFGKSAKCQEYLRIVPYCLPMRQVMIGQSSYVDDILPRYASAFAFDYRIYKSWTPTSQVLAQAMNMFHGCDIGTSLCIISNSYLLLPRGIVLLNVIPYVKVHDQAQAKLSSYLAELLSDIHKSSYILRSKPILQCEFGDEAKITGDIFWASVRHSKLPIRRLSVRNPVWISRTYASNAHASGKILQPKTHRDSMRLYQEYGAIETGRKEFTPKSYRWNDYKSEELVSIRPLQTLSIVSSIANEESIEGLRKSFASTLGSMPQLRVPSKEEDGEGYEHAVLKFVSECALKHTNATQEILEVLIKISKSLNSTDRSQVENLISNCRTAVSAASYASAFFASVPGTISGDTSAIALSSSSVPPIVRMATFRGTEDLHPSKDESREASSRKNKGKGKEKDKGKERTKGLILKPTLGPGPANTSDYVRNIDTSPSMLGGSVVDIAKELYEVTPSPIYTSAPSHYGESISEWGNTYEGLSHASEIETEDFSGSMDEQDKELIEAHKDAFAPAFKSPDTFVGSRDSDNGERTQRASTEALMPKPEVPEDAPIVAKDPVRVTSHEGSGIQDQRKEDSQPVSPFKPKSGRRLKLGVSPPPNTSPKIRRK